MKANNIEDVKLLSNTIQNFPINEIYKLNAAFIYLGLMYPNLKYLIILKFIKFLRGYSGLEVFFIELQKREPNTCRQLILQTANHCLRDKDREDKDSVGGFSQREIDLFLNFYEKQYHKKFI